MEDVYVCGNGGHAMSVASACVALGLRCICLDDGVWEGEVASAGGTMKTFAAGIGHRARRAAMCKQLLSTPCVSLRTIVHPTAFVDPTAVVHPGTFIGAFAYIGPQAVVGPLAIVNTRAVVEHGAVVLEGAHVSVGASLCGGARLGRFSDLFAHACVLPTVCVGDDVVIGAGALVTKDVPPGPRTMVGVPARRVA